MTRTITETNVQTGKKRRMWPKVLMVLGVLIIVLLVVIAMRPDAYRVERSAKIAASQAMLFDQTNDLHKFATWNPWGSIDPNMKVSYAGPAAGVGSSYSWAGNNEVGEGKMTITESKPSELVKMRLDFYKPMAGVADATFTMKPQGSETVFTWSMEGKHNFMGKAIGLVMNMDKMIGEQFEKGLEKLKKDSEAPVAQSQWHKE